MKNKEKGKGEGWVGEREKEEIVSARALSLFFFGSPILSFFFSSSLPFLQRSS